MPSRDQLTRQMAGDAFGSVSDRSRFATGTTTGDPFFPIALIAGQLAKKGLGALARKYAARGVNPAQMQRSPVFGGSALPIEENTSYIQRAIKGRRVAPRGFPSLPAGSRRQVFPAGVGATRARRHRMRVTNVKALRRAMRRVQGFAKLAHKTISFTKRIHMRKRRARR
jgi:hypothetical protein